MAFAQTETVLHQFQATTSQDGSVPYSGLIAGPKGQLFGNAWFGGSSGNGEVFELLPPASGGGSWSYRILYNFGPAPDGANPRGNLLADRKGNLYGVTQDGGTFGCGTVFELTPPTQSGAVWTESVLYSFNCINGNLDGAGPAAGVIFDNAGNLYGTTVGGGTVGDGTVFRLTPPSTAGSSWTETVLHSFIGPPDGANPFGSLTFDGHNAFYGFTPYGGTSGTGALYQVTSAGHEVILHNFQDRQDGGFPVTAPLLDSLGNLYGSANGGGTTNNGIVFEFLRPTSSAQHWTESVLHNFTGADGSSCQGLIFDSTGTLYGTTWAGGSSGFGVVFKLTPPSSGGSWTQQVLHSFIGGASDGSFVWTSPVLVNGTLYGVTHWGGTANQGAVFAVTP
jgi:uncharacterized repeat protein (TIGR03803 family)